MQITIAYDSSWRNSLSDGDNNEPSQKGGGRKYKASLSNLNPKQKNKETTYDYRGITESTVMGLLNRLIGDQRKLYQSESSDNYYFENIQKNISWNDCAIETQEMTYLRNMLGSFDQNSFIGAIKTNIPLIASDFSPKLWGVLNLDFSQLLEFFLNDGKKVDSMENIDPFLIVEKIKAAKNINLNKLEETDKESFNKTLVLLKNDIKSSTELKNMFPKMMKAFDEGVYLKGDSVQVGALYCSAIYMQILRLSKEYDTSNIPIKGISVNTLTPKNFLEMFTGGKKLIYGNPYYYDTYVKGEGKIRKLMTKASGKLEIKLDISKDKAKEIRTMIRDAGVSSFYLGKKGLAYVEDIKVAEIRK